jgi:hypothetical protein
MGVIGLATPSVLSQGQMGVAVKVGAVLASVSVEEDAYLAVVVE